MKNINLNPKVAAEFKLKGNVPGTAFTTVDFGRIDFSEMTLKQAEQLERKKFPFLERKTAVADEVKAEDKKKK